MPLGAWGFKSPLPHDVKVQMSGPFGGPSPRSEAIARQVHDGPTLLATADVSNLLSTGETPTYAITNLGTYPSARTSCAGRSEDRSFYPLQRYGAVRAGTTRHWRGQSSSVLLKYRNPGDFRK